MITDDIPWAEAVPPLDLASAAALRDAMSLAFADYHQEDPTRHYFFYDDGGGSELAFDAATGWLVVSDRDQSETIDPDLVERDPELDDTAVFIDWDLSGAARWQDGAWQDGLGFPGVIVNQLPDLGSMTEYVDLTRLEPFDQSTIEDMDAQGLLDSDDFSDHVQALFEAISRGDWHKRHIEVLLARPEPDRVATVMARLEVWRTVLTSVRTLRS